jgi:hypothetical protein
MFLQLTVHYLHFSNNSSQKLSSPSFPQLVQRRKSNWTVNAKQCDVNQDFWLTTSFIQLWSTSCEETKRGKKIV